MKHWFIKSLILSIGLISLKAQGESCVINYPDYTKMDYIKRWFYSVDYRLTHEFMTNSENRAALKAKGYKLNRNPLVLFNDGFGDLALQGPSPSVIRVNEEGGLKLRKNFSHPDHGKPMVFDFNYSSVKEIPYCGALKKGVKESITFRSIYLKAHEAYQDGRYGDAMIYLEALAKTLKNLPVDAPRALRRYGFLRLQLTTKLKALPEDATWGAKLELLRQSLLSQQVSSYTRSQTSIIDALEGDGANCVGNSALFSALVHDLDITAPKGFAYGIELWIRHKQFVAVNVDKQIVYDVVANEIRGKLVTPIMGIDAHLRDALAKFQNAVWRSDSIQVSKLGRRDYLFMTPEPEERNEVDIDGFKKGRKENPTRYTEEELRNRIDIFSMDYDRFTLAEYSDGPIPRRASNAHLISRKITYTEGAERHSKLLEGLGLGGSVADGQDQGEKERSRFASGKPYFALQAFNQHIYDEEARAAYKAAFERGSYLPEDIEKYGMHHIASYFPSSNPIHHWEHMLFPLKLKESNIPADKMKFLEDGSPIASVSIQGQWDGSFALGAGRRLVRQLVDMPMVERYRYFFDRFKGEIITLRDSVIPSLIEVHRGERSMEELPHLLIEISKSKDMISFCDKEWIQAQLFRDFKCRDFIEFNVPGFGNRVVELFESYENFMELALSKPDEFIRILNNQSGEDLKFIQRKTVHALNVIFRTYDNRIPNGVRRKSPNFRYTLKALASHMLRNKNYFYTSPLSEGEELPEDLFSSDGAVNSWSYEPNTFEKFLEQNSPPGIDASVDLSPDVELPRCDFGSLGICVAGTASQMKQSEIERETRFLKPDTFVFLAKFLEHTVRPDDIAFLALAWRKSHKESNLNFNVGTMLQGDRERALRTKFLEFNPLGGGMIRGCDIYTDPTEYKHCILKVVKSKYDKLKTEGGSLSKYPYLAPLIIHALKVKDLIGDEPSFIGYPGVELGSEGSVSYDFSEGLFEQFNLTPEHSESLDMVNEVYSHEMDHFYFQYNTNPSRTSQTGSEYYINTLTTMFRQGGFYKGGAFYSYSYVVASDGSNDLGALIIPLMPTDNPIRGMEYLAGPNAKVHPLYVKFEDTLL